jgi:hypothetical protein
VTDSAEHTRAAGFRCALADCGSPSAVRVARLIPPAGLTQAHFVAAGIDSIDHPGVPLCVEHAHSALDRFLLATRQVGSP